MVILAAGSSGLSSESAFDQTNATVMLDKAEHDRKDRALASDGKQP
jgi:hypothetical protein